MKSVRLGSSIKVKINGKEDFLTVDSSSGDIILTKNGRTIVEENMMVTHLSTIMKFML